MVKCLSKVSCIEIRKAPLLTTLWLFIVLDQGWGTGFLRRAVLIVKIHSRAADSEGATSFSHRTQAKGPQTDYGWGLGGKPR